MKQVPTSVLTLLAGIVITLISFWVGQNHHLLPEQASEQAPLVDNFFSVMLTIGTALFLVVEGAIFLFAWVFRQRKGDETDGVPIEGSFSLEIVWTAIPAIIVIWLGIYSVDIYQKMGGIPSVGMMAHNHGAQVTTVAKVPPDAAIAATTDPTTTQMKVATTYGIAKNGIHQSQSPDLAVNVTALQYAWIFNYADSGIVSGELHVPVGKDVVLNLAAQDVIHSFWVPQFRLKQDVIPGQAAQLRFRATKAGSYPIVCTELCGAYHGSMRTKVIAQTPEDYDAWVISNRVAQQPDATETIAANVTPATLVTAYMGDLEITPDLLAALPHGEQPQSH
jgi:cytochrome c oxidase subunit 2